MQKEEEQEFLKEQQLQAQKEAAAKKEYDDWEAERIKMDADIELSKLVKIEEQEVPDFDVGTWLKDFMTKKQKEYNAKRRKISYSMVQLLYKKEKGYEQYLRNIKGYKLVQLKPYLDIKGLTSIQRFN